MISKDKNDIFSKEQKAVYKNVIFDLGAVLINWNPRELIQNEWVHTKQKPWYLLEVATSLAWLDMDRGVCALEEFVQKLSSSYSPQELLYFVDLVKKNLIPLQEGLDILGRVQAQGYNTYVLSNMSQWAYEHIVHYDFLKTFTGHIFSYQVKTVKPEPEIYQLLLSTYGLRARECLFIDDMQKNIDAAQEAGIDGIVCTDHVYVATELIKRGVL